MPISNIRVLKPGPEFMHLLSREYPLCWPMAFNSDFEGSYDVDEVTCPECLDIWKDTAHAS
jgi:hypothetical protein